jgi:anti-anti-sigma factor
MHAEELHQLELEIAVDGDRMRIRVRGELDTTSAPRLISAVQDLVGGTTGIDVDCGDVWFLDSAGIRALIVIRNDALRMGVDFAVVRASETVTRLLDMTGLTATLTRSALN